MSLFPFVFGFIESKSGLYECETFEVHLERQRPALIQASVKEPMVPGESVIFEMGYLGKMNRHTLATVESCSQKAPETFVVTLLEPVRQILSKPLIKQYAEVKLETVLRDIASGTGLDFVKKGVFESELENLILLDTIRNALDQCWSIYECETARWAIDLLTKRFLFLAEGKLPGEPVEIPIDYFKSEFDNGVVINILPSLKPYTPVIWRDEEKIIDIVRINNKSKSMYLTFASN
jgi:hypothetical protein